MQIPVAIPPNLDPAIAKQVIEYLKANPEAAQQSYEEANRLLQTPGMAQMMLDAKVDWQPRKECLANQKGHSAEHSDSCQ